MKGVSGFINSDRIINEHYRAMTGIKAYPKADSFLFRGGMFHTSFWADVDGYVWGHDSEYRKGNRLVVKMKRYKRLDHISKYLFPTEIDFFANNAK